MMTLDDPPIDLGLIGFPDGDLDDFVRLMQAQEGVAMPNLPCYQQHPAACLPAYMQAIDSKQFQGSVSAHFEQQRRRLISGISSSPLKEHCNSVKVEAQAPHLQLHSSSSDFSSCTEKNPTVPELGLELESRYSNLLQEVHTQAFAMSPTHQQQHTLATSPMEQPTAPTQEQPATAPQSSCPPVRGTSARLAARHRTVSLQQITDDSDDDNSESGNKAPVSHSTVEKQRRDRLNTLIEDIAELVPSSDPKYGAEGAGERSKC